MGVLWKGFGDRAEDVITNMYPQAAPFVDESFRQGVTPESAALELVTNVLVGYIHEGMAVDQKRAVLVELHQLTKMGFEQAEGYAALPFVAHVVSAWLVLQQWAAAGKIEAAGPFLRTIIAALATALEAGP